MPDVLENPVGRWWPLAGVFSEDETFILLERDECKSCNELDEMFNCILANEGVHLKECRFVQKEHYEAFEVAMFYANIEKGFIPIGP